ncbi:MAG TPA: GntR family transcriptional regulator [Telluria sp.]|nr:GntR family transcriptional regulator [Telluria sp.]
MSSIDAAGRAYAVLRERIVSAEIKPGSRLSEQDLAAELFLSRTPVHDAVRRLASEQLVEVRPRAGTFVARLVPDALEEALLVRGALELMVVEKAAERANSQSIAALREVLVRQAASARDGDAALFRRLGDEFHARLAEAAGMPGVWELVRQPKTHLDRYRALVNPGAARMTAALGEHGDIVRAVESRHPGRAAQAMRTHLRHVVPGLSVALALRPEYVTAR